MGGVSILGESNGVPLPFSYLGNKLGNNYRIRRWSNTHRWHTTDECSANHLLIGIKREHLKPLYCRVI